MQLHAPKNAALKEAQSAKRVGPVGAVVLELLPYNWEWKGISQVYHNVTTSVGDIHHFAWRAKHPRWAQYMTEDEARYAHWTAEECSSRSPAAVLKLTDSFQSCIRSGHQKVALCMGDKVWWSTAGNIFVQHDTLLHYVPRSGPVALATHA